jgi:polyhydroxyalkanoate synthesis repressor PhaR
VVIKKYPNRRLYDTSSGRYVNLDDVAMLIRQGADVQVVDARTGEDLTRVVLTQIIVDDVKGQPASLPLELLRELVIATDRALSDVRSAALSPFQLMKSLLTPQTSEAQTELEQLRRRVAELEARAETRPTGSTRRTGSKTRRRKPGAGSREE